MKKFIRTVGGKAVLFICTALALIIFAGSICGVVLCAVGGVYTQGKDELKDRYFTDAMSGDMYYITDHIDAYGDAVYHDYRTTNLRYAAYDEDGELLAVSEAIGDPDVEEWQYRVRIGFYKDDVPYEYDVYSISSYTGDVVYSSPWKPFYEEDYDFYEVKAAIDRDFNTIDKYYHIDRIIDLGYSLRYALIPIGIAALAAAIFSFVALMCASGRRVLHEGEPDEVHPGVLNRIPFDVMLAVIAFAVGVGVACIIELSYSADVGAIAVAALGGVILLNIFLGLCMSIAARLKQGTLIKNTLIAMTCRLLWRMLKALGRGIKKISGKTAMLFREIPMVWKTAVIYAAVFFTELIFILACWWETDALIVWWLVEKMIMAPVIMYSAICLRRLQKAGEKLAAGELSYKADTRGIFWDFKHHAENLNSISDGMSRAVDERMKSERMKTELITNVSHDIKTPLTSIINYADLISREKCDNEKIAEYAEVLSRQSDRLKRLIEDLVEASKAATGNLEVMLSLCDAGVFISQAVGEYEQKLNDAGLQTVVTQFDEAVYVMADGRRMLRVFDNLMNNICKYAQSGTRVYLSLEKIGNKAVITFKNTSRDPLNISADELMERFVRGDSSRNTEGNGLGLSIAKSLTELQGGTLTLSVDGDLFKVILSFPIAERS